MKTILLPKRTLVFVFFIASLLFSNISFGQTVLLDQADLDYAPGETVYITGFGWHPGETVILEVANLTNPNVDCGPVSPQPHVSWTTVADENGNFTASWYVNDCELGADLLLGALGETSGFTYEVFFTDANVSFKANGLPNGTNVTVNYRVYSTGSPGGSFTAINFTTPNNSTPAIAVNNSQTVEYTFNDVVISGTIYKALGGTAVGANNGAGGQLITANYTIACTTLAAPVVTSPVTYCQGATATALTATGSNLLWYTTETEGIGSTTPPTPSTTSIGTTSYYVSQSTECESTRAKIDVVINGVTAGIIGKGAVQPGPGCGTLDPGITSNTSAASGSGTLSYLWQQSTDGGSNWSTIPSATSSQYNPSALTMTTSFKRIVTSNLNGINCTAESNILVYEVNPLPVVSAVLPGGTTNVCIGNTLQLSNATQGGVWNSQNTANATVDSSGLVSGITSGDVTISYTVTDPNSGCFKTVNKTVHVLALPVAPIAIDYSGVYDGVSHTGLATVNSGEAIYWYTTATGTTTSSAPSGTNVGTYSAYAESRNISTGCISPIRTLVTVNITPKSATIVADGKTKIYGEVNPLLTAQISGTVNGDALDYSIATTATQFSGVGSYPIAITLGSNPNYSITPTDSELSITPKSATIVADGKTKIYGEVNPLLTAQISGTVNGDALDYSLATTATQFSGVGSYPIAITLGSNPNYSIT
ncbi:MBG domain-containing protein, partial [Flavobacterium sp. MAHUQ-51]|uniref:MBG domain-containing protein n=1 Tax=Flavobacterium sp. GCM10022190 TaxID=3252639 RepID=UPI00361F9E89